MAKNGSGKNIINLYVPKNNALYVSVIAIILLIGVLLYLKPSLFVFLFHTFLGNVLLISCLLLSGYFDKKLAFGLTLLFSIIYLASSLSSLSSLSSNKKKEGFNTVKWPQKTVDDFLAFEKIRNPNIQYDMNIVQQQATLDEVNKLLSTGRWPWSDKVKQMYKNAIATNSYISVAPGESLNDAQTIYNETAIKQVLSWNTKEGIFLINGAIIGHPSGMPANINNLVRCGLDESGNSVMEKIVYKGYNGINGSMNVIHKPLANSDIPKQVSGFSFLKGVCNPCVALNSHADYSCPFSINTGNGSQVSDVWANLWSLGGVKKDNIIKKNDFPLLKELRDELVSAKI